MYSTRYNKWSSLERDTLFSKLRYAHATKSIIAGACPKLCSEVENRIVQKLLGFRPLAEAYSSSPSHRIYYSRKVGYFLQILDFEPRVIDGRGQLRPPSEFKELRFNSAGAAHAALAALNSNLFYWFITVFSDCRHVNKREVDAFPIDAAKLGRDSVGKRLYSLASDLMDDLRANSREQQMRFAHDVLKVQCIYPKASKPILDEIDSVLALHYGFDEEEVDFIINYDIKYRMGSQDADDGDPDAE
jgi:hypothetical protein